VRVQLQQLPPNTVKQLIGIESCQCCKARIQRNTKVCAMLIRLRLKGLAYKTYQTVYELKHGLLSNYLSEQLKRPASPMSML
jgi:hypothetical protein